MEVALTSPAPPSPLDFCEVWMHCWVCGYGEVELVVSWAVWDGDSLGLVGVPCVLCGQGVLYSEHVDAFIHFPTFLLDISFCTMLSVSFFVCLFIYLLCAVATAAVSYMTYLGDYWMTFTITSHRSLVGFSWLIKSDYSSSMKAILCFSHVTGFCLWNIWGLHSFCSVYHTKALKKDI